MAVFKNPPGRGPAAPARRGTTLRAFADLGVIEYGRPVGFPGQKHKPTQYVVRIGDPLAPWRFMDGQELMPWLPGIAESALVHRPDDEATARMWEILRPFLALADEVPPEHLAELPTPDGAAPPS